MKAAVTVLATMRAKPATSLLPAPCCHAFSTQSKPVVKNGKIGREATRRIHRALNVDLHESRTSSSPSYGEGMNQVDLMEQDMLVAVDQNDRTITDFSSLPGSPGSLSKKMAHAFSAEWPRGVAHRAFSVFLFNERNELLLTRRALSKITFPGVWTNTCCSHPIIGQIPNEVDDVDVDFPNFRGIKNAAVRKLRHELGILPSDVPISQFHFLTRFHYWAADTGTYGSRNPPWGEHEIDYVLFIKSANPTIHANEEEVVEHRFVDPANLRRMMRVDSGFLWSPWFQGIMDRVGFQWWDHLDECLVPGSRFCNQDITFFDPLKQFHADFNTQEHDQSTGVLRATYCACNDV